MGRIHKKLTSHWFKKGSIPYNKGLKLDEVKSQTESDVQSPKTVRLTAEMFDLVTKDVNHKVLLRAASLNQFAGQPLSRGDSTTASPSA